MPAAPAAGPWGREGLGNRVGTGLCGGTGGAEGKDLGLQSLPAPRFTPSNLPSTLPLPPEVPPAPRSPGAGWAVVAAPRAHWAGTGSCGESTGPSGGARSWPDPARDPQPYPWPPSPSSPRPSASLGMREMGLAGWGAKGGGLQEPSSRILMVSWRGKGRCWQLETAPRGGGHNIWGLLGSHLEACGQPVRRAVPIVAGRGRREPGEGAEWGGVLHLPKDPPPRPEIVAQGLASAPGGEV